jgi:saccharopepsin
MHPLDLSEITDATVDGQPYTVCVSSFMGMDDWGQGDFDLSLGDTFLRNVYSVFDFGDTLPDGTTGEPYMQLLSEVDAAKAAAQVASIRGKTLATLPPEMDPATLIGLLGGSATVPTPTASDVIGGPTTTDSTKSTSTSKANSLAAGHGNNVYDNDTVKHYGLIVIGLLGANLLIGLVLIAFAVVGCIRRGTSRKAASRNLDYAPVKNVDLDHAFNAPSYNAPNYQKGYSQ